MQPADKYKVSYSNGNGVVNGGLNYQQPKNRSKLRFLLIPVILASIGGGAYFAVPEVRDRMSKKDIVSDSSSVGLRSSNDLPVATVKKVEVPPPEKSPTPPPVSTSTNKAPAATSAAKPKAPAANTTQTPAKPSVDTAAIAEVENLAQNFTAASSRMAALQSSYGDAAKSYQNTSDAIAILAPLKQQIAGRKSANPYAVQIFQVYGSFVEGMIKGLSDAKALGQNRSASGYQSAMRPYYDAVDFYNTNSTLLSSDYTKLKSGN